MSAVQLPAEYEPPTPVEELSARSADGSRLHVEVHGRPGAPTVVLAHGWTCSTAFWAPVIRELADRYRVVAYDQRGHGHSEIPPSRARYSTRALAEDLSAVLARTVPAGERAVLAGHSMGGMTIMAAGSRPEVAERTAAAVLISTGPGELVAELTVLPPTVRSPKLRRFLHRQLLRSRLPLGPVSPVSRAALKYATMGPSSPAGQVEATARIVHACPTAVRANWAAVLDRLDVHAGLGRLAAPTSVVVGTDDRLTPPVHAHRIVAELKDPQGLLLLPGVGHMSPLERPAEVAGEIHRMAAEHLVGAPAVTVAVPVVPAPTVPAPAVPAPASADSADPTDERTAVA
ncbi:pimeloyl-ACP methyl ester carboxylesterase [Streptomyces sp. 1114.5]|uniref:alpha/beta fold hydrolase n=1 Tax=Streptomyces sp. 1114.5 TaxID=1938830 RepID=UPI000EAEFF97|nr:alpha/beta hydrolase [Streptomyces sp. 1114.5]RKT11682.1 pimeloyl-ACP methyl ester carboxylesterase [Streptomyces sp. 1114.5]